MDRQPFLTIVGLMKRSLTATSRLFLSVLAILVLGPALAAAGDPLSSWDKQMKAKGRFEVLPAFDNAAVLDKETGLVWEQSPDTTARNWDVARFLCIVKTVGGRQGWRLPSIPELASLVDPSVAFPGPTLPPGHPFTNVQGSGYWTATTDAGSPTDAWRVAFGEGSGGTFPKVGLDFFWCVRGPMQESVY